MQFPSFFFIYFCAGWGAGGVGVMVSSRPLIVQPRSTCNKWNVRHLFFLRRYVFFIIYEKRETIDDIADECCKDTIFGEILLIYNISKIWRKLIDEVVSRFKITKGDYR